MAEIRKKAKRLGGVLGRATVLVLGVTLGLSVASAAPPAKVKPKPKKQKTAELVTPEADATPGAKRPTTRLMVSGKFLHVSCNRSLRDMKNNKEECFGNVYIRRPSELLTADYAILDLNSEQMHAEGNVVYITADTVIYGAKMDFNFVTDTGVIYDGRVESDKYQLVGERIERISANHFKAIDGEYTTCRDCPASWRLVGSSIDLTVEGYAWLKNVYIKVNEAPILYLPAAVLPVKTKRQSGFLFPKISQSFDKGFMFTQPYFWAISRSQDVTLALGNYSLRGVKGELEYRYMLSPRSSGQLNAFYLRDRSFIRDPYYNRWAAEYHHNLELPWGIEQKLRYLDASDRDYPSKIGDIPGRGEPGLISEAGLSKTGRDVSVWVTAKRIRNIITPNIVGVDPNTVQVFPSISVATTDHKIFEGVPLRWGFSANYTRFYRVAPSFDPTYHKNFVGADANDFFLGRTDDFALSDPNIFLPGQTPLRRAQRLNMVPEIYYPLKIANNFELTPSAQYRTFYYVFDKNVVSSLRRGYLLAQAEFATTIEHVYGDKVKHKFRPSLTYSNIPIVQQNADHPFIQQIKTAGNEFDEFDIVPVTNDTQLYFVPLGNSLSYRLGNKFIFKTDNKPAVYRKVVDVTAGQSINFKEFEKSRFQQRQPFSRFFTMATVETLRVNGHAEYYYYPYVRQPTYNVTLSYTFSKYTRRLLRFERSLSVNYNFDRVVGNANDIGGGYNFSFNDYFSMNAGVSYRFPTTQGGAESPGVLLGVNGGLTYQSPSQCYKFVLSGQWRIDQPKVQLNWSIPVNLSGEGFSDLQDSNSVVPSGSR